MSTAPTTRDARPALPAHSSTAFLDALAASPLLTDEEKQALALAGMPLVPMERLELLHFLGYPDDLPNGYPARMFAVFTKILEDRGVPPVPPVPFLVPPTVGGA